MSFSPLEQDAIIQLKGSSAGSLKDRLDARSGSCPTQIPQKLCCPKGIIGWTRSAANSRPQPTRRLLTRPYATEAQGRESLAREREEPQAPVTMIILDTNILCFSEMIPQRLEQARPHCGTAAGRAGLHHDHHLRRTVSRLDGLCGKGAHAPAADSRLQSALQAF